MDWTLGTKLRVEHQPAPAPVIYITGKNIDNPDDVERLGAMLSERVFKGKVVDFGDVMRNVDLDFNPKFDIQAGAKIGILNTMLVNIAGKRMGGGLAKGTIFVFTMPDPSFENKVRFMKCCKLLADKRGSTLLHIEVEPIMARNQMTISLGYSVVGKMNTSINHIFTPDIPWEASVEGVHFTLCALVSTKERAHLIKDEYMDLDPDFRPEDGRICNLEEACRDNINEAVQFICLIETKPVWIREEGLLIMRVCDRTASIYITFNVIEDSDDLPILLAMEPGTAQQLTCEIGGTMPLSRRREVFPILNEKVQSAFKNLIPAAKGFVNSARASISQKLRSFRKY